MKLCSTIRTKQFTRKELESSRRRSSALVLAHLLNNLKGVSINNRRMRIFKSLSIIFVVHHTLFASVVFSGSFEVDRVADILLPFKNFADGVMIPMVRISVTKLDNQGLEISGRR